MNQSDADRAGLVESHAYAMLDIREVMVSETTTLVDLFIVFRLLLHVVECQMQHNMKYCLIDFSEDKYMYI